MGKRLKNNLPENRYRFSNSSIICLSRHTIGCNAESISGVGVDVVEMLRLFVVGIE